MVPFMASLAAVGLGQLDALAVDMVDRADMDAVGADDFHMFLDCARISHVQSSFVTGAIPKRTQSGFDARGDKSLWS
jgi:hypothetical protein